jgi:hypothetical protein
MDDIENQVDFAVAFGDLTSVTFDRLMDPAWRIREKLTGVGKKVTHDRNLVRNHAFRIIEKRRAEGYLKLNKDLLQLFMEAKDDEGNDLTDDHLVDIILNFTIAGRDTTAQALSWMFYLISRDGTDKSILKTLIQEVDDVLGDKLPTYESHKQQKFADAWYVIPTCNSFASIDFSFLLGDCVEFPEHEHAKVLSLRPLGPNACIASTYLLCLLRATKINSIFFNLFSRPVRCRRLP